jgi:hypothetical protein
MQIKEWQSSRIQQMLARMQGAGGKEALLTVGGNVKITMEVHQKIKNKTTT